MKKHIEDPRTIFKEVTEDYKAVFEGDLVAIVLYGSAAGPDFQPGSSDINFMVALTEKGIDRLDQAFDVVAKWRKRGAAVPLFVTEAYIRGSLDVFPIEYLGFQRTHVQVFGKEILHPLEIKPEFLRLQCEREIKGKLLLLREAFLESGGKAKHLTAVVKEAVPALIAIFEGLLYLKNIPIPGTRRETVRAAADALGIDGGVFDGILNIREGKSSLKDEAAAAVFKGCLREMRRLSHIIDTFDQK
jgi:predicted nucleotidyltransferase